MRCAIVALSALVLFGATGAMCERISQDMAKPPALDLNDPAGEDTSQIKTAILRGEERFVDAPSAGTAASWGMEVLLAVLSVATGGLGMTQLRDRNARRRVEDQTHELERLVTAIQVVIQQHPGAGEWLSGLGLAPPVPPIPPVPDQAGGGGAT